MKALLAKLGCEMQEVETLMKVYRSDTSKPFSVAAFMAWMWNEG